MTLERRQRLHAFASIAVFVVAALLVVALPLVSRQRVSWPAALLSIVGALVITLIAINGLPVRGLRIRRGDFSAEALFQDAPVEIPLFALMSPESAAIAALGGFTLAAALRTGPGRLDLLRHGAVRALLVLLLAPLRPDLLALALAPTVGGAIWFMILGTAAALCIVFVCSLPFVALHTSLSLGVAMQRLGRDKRLWSGVFVTVFWSYVIARLAPSGVPAAIISLWLPVVAYSLLLRRIDDQAVELHRLRLVRDAVQAMLGARDPLPQINAILSSIHGTLIDETISIITASSPAVDDWKVVASLGQQPTTADVELRRRTLSRLKFAGMPSVVLQGDYASMHAFGIRLSDDEDLLGALLVRRKGAPVPDNAQKQYVAAAREIAPLLRDIRSIAAQQSAATTDALTGLKNRAAIFDRLRAMLGDVVRNGAILLFDLDHFKRINDELGHAAGDQVLRRVSEIALDSVRAGDAVGRIGGEEFLVVMPGATSDSAMMVGERLRLSISLSGLRHATGDPVTASLGVAAATIGDTAETLVARADAALYEAKRAGRNRIIEGVAESA
ncbi:MAG: GGDEF domain-containing protein [Candidatus Eremiobacteraeota bacterium]|nr:GGDEF domain-containing protein [Candidatus Eremiobacteraeota bacterium]